MAKEMAEPLRVYWGSEGEEVGQTESPGSGRIDQTEPLPRA